MSAGMIGDDMDNPSYIDSNEDGLSAMGYKQGN